MYEISLNRKESSQSRIKNHSPNVGFWCLNKPSTTGFLDLFGEWSYNALISSITFMNKAVSVTKYHGEGFYSFTIHPW